MAKAIEYGDLEFGKEPVGTGGSATVYKGRWKSRDMTVAVKTSVQGIPDSEVWFPVPVYYSAAPAAYQTNRSICDKSTKIGPHMEYLRVLLTAAIIEHVIV